MGGMREQIHRAHQRLGSIANKKVVENRFALILHYKKKYSFEFLDEIAIKYINVSEDQGEFES